MKEEEGRKDRGKGKMNITGTIALQDFDRKDGEKGSTTPFGGET